MRVEKKILTNQYLEWLNSSPFFIVLNYQGLTVGPINELRRRLAKAGAELHVVKNSQFRLAVREAGLPELGGMLSGQSAVVIGRRDVSAAAKVVKTFSAEFEKPKMRFGYLNNRRLSESDLIALAELPSLEGLRAMLLWVWSEPAARLLRLMHTPARQLASVLQARVDKG